MPLASFSTSLNKPPLFFWIEFIFKGHMVCDYLGYLLPCSYPGVLALPDRHFLMLGRKRDEFVGIKNPFTFCLIEFDLEQNICNILAWAPHLFSSLPRTGFSNKVLTLCLWFQFSLTVNAQLMLSKRSRQVLAILLETWNKTCLLSLLDAPLRSSSMSSNFWIAIWMDLALSLSLSLPFPHLWNN